MEWMSDKIDFKWHYGESEAQCLVVNVLFCIHFCSLHLILLCALFGGVRVLFKSERQLM
jgi:hypothetical protein